MDLSNPIRSVVPSAHGAVLAVLAHTHEPLSGRRVAALTQGMAGQWRVNEVLGALADAGIVLREERPPAKLYRLNRDHVAAPGIIVLADLWGALLQRVRDEVAAWGVAPVAAWVFGSAARGEAGPESDIDVLVVTPDAVGSDVSSGAAAEVQWRSQIDGLIERVTLWSGNSCEVLELTRAELSAAVGRDDRLVRDLRDHAIPLTEANARQLLRAKAAQ